MLSDSLSVTFPLSGLCGPRQRSSDADAPDSVQQCVLGECESHGSVLQEASRTRARTVRQDHLGDEGGRGKTALFLASL